MRHLSHAELLRMFQRASIRAEIPLEYSQGYNPRPKLNLPLPKSVGIEVDNDLLWMQITENDKPLPVKKITEKLSKNLPQGCKLILAELFTSKVNVRPFSADYQICVQPKFISSHFLNNIEQLMKEQNIYIERQIDGKGTVRRIDVRPFLIEIKSRENTITARCSITTNGSIRVDEILTLLELTQKKLQAPVKRANVKWKAA